MRILGVAFAFLLAMANAAEPPHPLMGVSRDQLLRRMGEPRSQISTGNRLVLLYPRERITLADDIVVDVELISAEPGRRDPSAESSGTPPGGTSTPTPGPSAPASVAPERSQPTPNAPSSPVTVTPSIPSGPEPKVEIKLVRPPSANYTRPSTTRQESAPVGAAPAPVTVATPVAVAADPQKKSPAPQVTAPAAPLAPVVETKEPSTPPVPSAEDVAKAEKLAAEVEAKEMKAKAIEATRRRLADAKVAENEPAPVSSGMLIAGAAVLLGGIGFFIWRRRQHQLELAATTVSNTPVGASSVTAPPIPRKGAMFTEDYFTELDPNRFEILVAAYFNKTGVVAARAKTGQGTVTQIRISWKGETKPFAGVLCIAHPTGPVEAKALIPMVAELEADDIRRGHVVTTGRFSAGAKQFGSEKQLTLLPGDALLEKLNGLPESARKEIMNAVVTGDAAAPA